jgi:predicted RNA methylase
MRKKTVELDDQTRDTLLRSKIEGCNLCLPGQLPRDEYMRVAKAIEAAGGKWNRKAGCHVFPGDVRKTLNIEADTVEVVDVQQTWQAFYTPPELAEAMVERAFAKTNGRLRVLEPSAGTGRLIDAIGMRLDWDVDITAVELNPAYASGLRMKYATVNVYEADFLQLDKDALGEFDVVVMNPPFTGGQDEAHIRHALRMLKMNGRLVAICGNGPRQREQLRSVADSWIDLAPGTFKESGTCVNTAMLIATKSFDL